MSDLKRRDPMTWFSWILGFLGMLLIFVGFQRSLNLYSVTGAVDFRNRVVAARQAELGLNPYTFKWNPTFSESLLDPSEERDAKYTRMTSPPTVLWIHSLFADLSWPVQKRGNFLLNWFSFFLIPLTLFIALRKREDKPAPLIGALAFGTGIMAISGIWQFHVERAQQYVFLTLMLSLAVFTHASAGRIFSGVVGILRPTLGFTLFLSFREKRIFRSVLIISAVGFLCLLPALLKYPLSWWLDYLACSKDWYLHRQGMHERITPSFLLPYPVAPEGDPTMSRALGFGGPGNIFHHYLMKMGLPLLTYSVGMSTVLLATGVTVWKLWKNRLEEIEIFALRFLSSVYVVDLLLPSPRSAYNGILFFPILLLSLYAILKKNVKNRDLLFHALVMVGAAFSLGSILSPRSIPHMVETCYFVAALGFLLRKPQQS